MARILIIAAMPAAANRVLARKIAAKRGLPYREIDNHHLEARLGSLHSRRIRSGACQADR